jgi:hypothetical protein
MIDYCGSKHAWILVGTDPCADAPVMWCKRCGVIEVSGRITRPDEDEPFVYTDEEIAENKRVNDDYDNAFRALDKLNEDLKLRSVWSILEVAHRMDEVAFVGTYTAAYKEHWGEGEVVGKTMTNPTWTDLWIAADDLIWASGDEHHVFIESFYPSDDGKKLYLGTGS